MFFDIGRSTFSTSSRSNDEYIKYFVSGIGQIDCQITVFTTRGALKQLSQAVGESDFRAKVDFEIVEFTDLPFSSSQEEIESALSGAAMRFYSIRDSLLPAVFIVKNFFGILFRRIFSKRLRIWGELPLKYPSAPEYTNWKYAVVTWAKPWLLHEAYSRGLASSGDQILFADFGLGHSKSPFVNILFDSRLKTEFLDGHNVALTYRNSLPSFSSPWEIAELIDDACIPAGLIGANQMGSMTLNNFFASEIRRHLNQGLVVDDQSLLALFGSRSQEDVKFYPAGSKYEFADISHFLEYAEEEPQ